MINNVLTVCSWWSARMIYAPLICHSWCFIKVLKGDFHKWVPLPNLTRWYSQNKQVHKKDSRIPDTRIPLKMGGCWFICLKWMHHIWSIKFISQISMNLFECKNRTANQLPWILADGRYNFGSCNCGRPCAFRSEKCLRWEVGGADGWWWRDEFFESLTFEDNDLLYIHPEN